jgi:hypothetical protein
MRYWLLIVPSNLPFISRLIRGSLSDQAKHLDLLATLYKNGILRRVSVNGEASRDHDFAGRGGGSGLKQERAIASLVSKTTCSLRR